MPVGAAHPRSDTLQDAVNTLAIRNQTRLHDVAGCIAEDATLKDELHGAKSTIHEEIEVGAYASIIGM